MSTNLLRLIPCIPTYRPTAIQRQNVLQLWQQFTTSPDRIRVVETDHLHFIDPGSNLKTVACPHCSQELSRAWWHTAMNHAFTTHFGDLAVVVPCCTRTESLNDLHYDWPAGFACFMLEMDDQLPHIQDAQAVLESALGCRSRWIRSHY